MKNRYINLTKKEAQDLVEHKLTLKGENMLRSGAKLVFQGGDLWLIKGYHYRGDDIKDEAIGY